MNKKLKMKLVILALSVILGSVSIVIGLKTYLRYKEVKTNYESLRSRIMSPINTNNSITSPKEVSTIIRGIDGLSEVKLIVEVNPDTKSMDTVKQYSMDEIANIQNSALIEFSLRSSDVGKSLEYLEDKNLSYQSLSIEEDVITLRVLVKGD
jgi:hypothetical protein